MFYNIIYRPSRESSKIRRTCDIPPHQAPQHPRWMPKWWLQRRDSQRFLLGKSPIAAPHPIVLRCTSLVVVLLSGFCHPIGPILFLLHAPNESWWHVQLWGFHGSHQWSAHDREVTLHSLCALQTPGSVRIKKHGKTIRKTVGWSCCGVCGCTKLLKDKEFAPPCLW